VQLDNGRFLRRERGRLREQDERHDASVLECIGNPLEILYTARLSRLWLCTRQWQADAAIAVALTDHYKSVSQGATSAVNASDLFIAGGVQ